MLKIIVKVSIEGSMWQNFTLLQGEWSPEDPNGVIPYPLSCVWVACVNAPFPTNGSGLTKLLYNGTDYDRETTEVEKGRDVEYRCFNGMRNRISPDLSAVQGSHLCVLFHLIIAFKYSAAYLFGP